MTEELLTNKQKALSECLQDSKGLLHVDGLMDAVLAIYNDCDHLTLRNKNFDTFCKRYSPVISTITQNRLSPQDFQLISVIGRGAFGEVHLVRMKYSRKVYAMKILSKFEMIRRSDTAFFWEERDIMAHTDSEWIVQLHYAFQDANNLYMVMDFVQGGNMVSLMEKYDIPEEWAQFYIAELVLALEAIHKMGYLHRDVKPENMLIDVTGHLKLADFGTCMKMDKNGKVRCETAVGTPDYISPEVLKSQGGEGYYGVECDWWSVGVVMYEMLMGDLPFFSESLIGTYSNIMNHKNTLQFKDEFISIKAKQIITQFLEDADHRLGLNGVEEVKRHPFFENDHWTWENIRSTVAHVIPECASEIDTTHFDDIDDSSTQPQAFAQPMEFQGNHLPFIGFTYQKDINVFQHSSLVRENSSKEAIAASKEMELELASVTKQKKEIELNYRTIEKKLQLLERENHTIKDSMQSLTQKFNETSKDLGIARIDLKEANRINKEREEEYILLKSRVQDLQSQLERSQGAESPTKLYSDIEQLKNQLKIEGQNLVALKETNQKLKQDLSVQESVVERLECRNEEIVAERDRMEKELLMLQCEADNHKKMLSDLESKNSELQSLTQSQTESISTLKSRITEVTEDSQRVKRSQAETEQLKASLELNLKTLQQRYDQLIKNNEQLSLQVEKSSTSSTVSNSDLSELQNQIETETTAKQTAEKKVGALEHRISIFELDMKQRTDEVFELQKQLEESQTNLKKEQELRVSLDSEAKEKQKSIEDKLAVKERELRGQVTELKGEKQKMEDTIYRLRSESKAIEATLRETRTELEEEKKITNSLRGKLSDGGNNIDKEITKLKGLNSELNTKLTAALNSKVTAEAKLADFEKEKMMIELDIKEIIARHKTEVTEKMAWSSKMRDQLIIMENKLGQKNLENEDLQDNLKRALIRVEELQRTEESYQEEIRKLNHQLEKEKVLKNEVVIKLSQEMERYLNRERGNKSNKPEPRRAHEREIRKLRGELQQETQKGKRIVEKYQQQLEEIQRQILEETQMRLELQAQLQATETKLKQVQQGIQVGSGSYVTNGPSTETDGSATNIALYQRETLIMQIPKGNDPRKKGWKDVFVVMSLTTKKLHIYERQEDMGTETPPQITLELGQIYSVRTLEQGEHERVRVKPNDAKRVLQLAYIDQSGDTSNLALPNKSDIEEGVVHVRGHYFEESRNSSRSSCDVCGKTLPLAFLSGGIYECKHCQMKCHKDDIEKIDLIRPCVAGEQDQKKLLLLIKNDDDRQHWLTMLSTATFSGSHPSTSSVIVPSANNKRDRTNSLRFSGKRPPSAQTGGRGSPGGGTNGRAYSVSTHTRRQKSTDSSTVTGATPRQVDLIRSMEMDNSTHSQ